MQEKTIRLNNPATYRRPIRMFENAGTVDPQTSYYVNRDNVTNTNKEDFKSMVDSGRYFSMFAPRQSGKTSFLEATCRQLHQDPTYVTIILSFEDYSDLNGPRFYSLIETSLYQQLLNRLEEVNCEKTETVRQFMNQHHLTDHISFKLFFMELNRILQFKKIVVFIDEFDGIPLNELAGFLTSLRSLYQTYKSIKQKALYSIGLIGIRNITQLIVGGVSPFNIADQVEMPPFSLKNITDLYSQYTEETGQPFTEQAIKKIYSETDGQPWLVNRLATILTKEIKPETTEPIDENDVSQAIQILLAERNAHFDNLYEKAKLYKETFIEIIFDHVEYNPDDEHQSFLEQYGLIKKKNFKAVVANNIYKLRYIKTFFKEVKADEDMPLNDYVLPGNKLDMERIILNFGRYISQIGVRAFYEKGKPYEKTGQFLLTAWLYQFVKGEETELRYELISGLGRMDVLLTYKGKKYIIETKMNHSHDLAGIIDEGIFQVSRKYLASEDTEIGYLIVFDTMTAVGTKCQPTIYPVGDKKIIAFIIGIGKDNKF